MPNEPLPNEPLQEEIEDQQIVDLPAREALSIVDPGIFGLRTPTILGRTADQPTAAEPAAPEGDPHT
jgi:hypothetical protein